MGRKKPKKKKSFSPMRAIKKWAPLGALAAPGVWTWFNTPGALAEKAHALTSLYTGFDMKAGQFRFERIVQGWGPMVGVKVASEIPTIINKIRAAI